MKEIPKPSGMKHLPLVIQVPHLYSLDLASRDVKIMNPAKNIGQVPVVANVIFLISKIYFLIFKSYF